MRQAAENAERQSVHVVERGRNQVTMPLKAGLKPHHRNPDMALMRQHDTLGHTRRTRRIEKHRRFVGPRHDRHKWSGYKKRVEIALVAELNARQLARAVLCT